MASLTERMIINNKHFGLPHLWTSLWTSVSFAPFLLVWVRCFDLSFPTLRSLSVRRDSKVNTTTAKTGFIPKWRHHRYRPIFMLRRPILPPSEPDILKSCTFRSSQVHAHSRDSVCRLRVSCVSPPDFAGVNSVVAGFKPEGFSLYWKIKIQIWAFLRFLAVFCPR